jgi:uncharacterized membrane protein YdbT with pleckstrin-like domain
LKRLGKKVDNIPENQIFKPSFLGIIPVALGLGFFVLFIPIIGLLLTPILLIVVFIAYMSIKVTSYEIKPEGLFIKKGIIAKKQILLLFSQIQDVSEYQTIWERIIGLKKLQIQTMTVGSAVDGGVSNLTVRDADTLKGIILGRINSGSKTKGRKSSSDLAIKEDLKEQLDDSLANPYPIHYLKLGLLYLAGAVIILTIIFSIYSFISKSLDFASILTWGFIILTGPVFTMIMQYTFKFWLSERTISIKNGLLSTQRTTLEYAKIQDFIVSNNILTSLMGLGSVSLETGSVIMVQKNNEKQIPNYSIDALDIPDALTIARFLLKKMGLTYSASEIPLVKNYPLSSKKPLKKTIASIFGLLILFTIICVGLNIYYAAAQEITVTTMNNIIMWVGMIEVALIPIIFLYETYYLKFYYYDLSKDTLTIRKGVFGKSQIYLPFEKIQNVYLDQDIFDRLFGLYDIHVSTVGVTSFRLCHIDGLTKENASMLLPVLLKQVKVNVAG